MKKILLSLLFVIFSAMPCSVAFAEEDGGQQVPEQVTIEHQCCKDVVELANKYDAEKKLPDSVVVDGKPCSKSELAECLLSVMDKVVDKSEKEGREAVPGEDLERIAALHDELKPELARYEGYLQRREAIEKILAKPEVPPFEFKAGVNGFLRGEGTGSLSLQDYSYTPGHGEGRFLYRVKPYAYWHPTDYLDIHVEGQAYGFTGSGPDFYRISLYQGYVEAKLPGKDWLALKVGRQEFNYGSAFILGPNSFFEGLTFDAARLRVKPLEALTLDLLGGYYSHPADNGFTGYLAGGYATYQFSDDNALDAYVLVDSGPVGDLSGTHLDIWGLRGALKLGPVSVEVEPVYESGRVFNGSTGRNENISAYGGHVDLALEADPWEYHNMVFLSYAMGSGSKDAAEGGSTRKEFMNPNNDTSLVGDLGFVGDLSGVNVGDHHASGLHDFTLGWGIDLTDNLNFTATGHYFRAVKVEDGFSRDIGIETDFTVTYGISDNLSLIVGYDRLFTGGFFRDATGSDDDIDYGYALIEFDFAKTKPKRL